MASIYDQHDKAFSQVSAYVIAKDGKKVGTIAFRFPRDGASRLWCYLRVSGFRMVRGYAGGYGYDKASAAAASAARGLRDPKINEFGQDDALLLEIAGILDRDDGYGWDRNLREVGFDVWQAV